MSWVTRNLRQTITIWTVASKDGYGKPTYTRSTAKGRWEDSLKKTVDAQGIDTVSSAQVWLNTDVATGSYLYLGSSTATSPPAGAREVLSFKSTPSIKATQFERKAMLK